jgi:hypothetical protein
VRVLASGRKRTRVAPVDREEPAGQVGPGDRAAPARDELSRGHAAKSQVDYFVSSNDTSRLLTPA